MILLRFVVARLGTRCLVVTFVCIFGLFAGFYLIAVAAAIAVAVVFVVVVFVIVVVVVVVAAVVAVIIVVVAADVCFVSLKHLLLLRLLLLLCRLFVLFRLRLFALGFVYHFHNGNVVVALKTFPPVFVDFIFLLFFTFINIYFLFSFIFMLVLFFFYWVCAATKCASVLVLCAIGFGCCVLDERCC